MTEKEVYQFYNDYVKVAYSEIEAAGNELPVELLFEIHSAFDHLKRIHIEGYSESACCEKAFSHLKRGLLDVFKLKLKYFNADYNALIGKSIRDLRLVDNGQFLPLLMKARDTIIKSARDARLGEGQNDIDLAFEKWYEVSVLITEFRNEYLDESKISWAKAVNYKHGIIGGVIGFIIGIGASIVAGLLLRLF